KATSATVTGTASSRTNATLAAVDEASVVALSTAVAVAVALDTAVADPGKMSSLTISGDGTAVDITGAGSGLDSSTVNSSAALGFSPISHRMAETLTDTGRVEVINGKPAGVVSETGAFKIDAGAVPQLDRSDAVNAPVITDGTNTDAINVSRDHATKTAWHASDDGRGGKTAHETPVSATREEASAQSTSADHHVIVSSPLTETLSGNGDHSASAFKPSADHDATVDPGINLASIPKDQLPQHSADNLIHIPAQSDHGADPAHPHVDGNQSANVKFADDGSAPSGTVPSDPPTLTALTSDPNGAHRPAARALAPDDDTPGQPTTAEKGNTGAANRKNNDTATPPPPQHPADNSPHASAQHDDDGSPAETDGAHPGRGQADRSDSASPKFADDGDAHPGKVSHEPPALTALSNDVSGPDSGQGPHPPHGQADRSEPASPKFADDGGTNPGKVPPAPPGLTALSSDVSGDDSAHGA